MEDHSWHVERVFPGYTSGGCVVSKAGLLATSTYDYVTHIFDIATGNEVSSLVGHSGFVRRAEFIADGRRVFTLSSTSRWSDEGFLPAPLSPEQSVRWFEGGRREPDVDYRGRSQGDGTARLWDVKSGRQLFEFSGPELNNSICSQDGRIVAVSTPYEGDGCCRGSKLELWDTTSHCVAESISAFQLENCRPFAFASNKALLFVLKRNAIEAWSYLDGVRRFVIRTDPFVDAIAGQFNRIWSHTVSPGQTLAAIAFERQPVEVWDLSVGKRAATLGKDTVNTDFVTFSDDDQLILTGGSSAGVQIHDPRAGTTIAKIAQKRFYGSMDFAVFSPDRSRVLIQLASEPAELFDAVDGRRVAVLSSPSRMRDGLEAGALIMTSAQGLCMPLVHFSPKGHCITNGNNCPQVWSSE
jgi:WD40 repeat protein